MRGLLGVKILEIFPAEIYTSVQCRATSCLPGKFVPAAEVTFEDGKGSIFFLMVIRTMVISNAFCSD